MILNFSYGRQGCVWQQKSKRPWKRNAFYHIVHKRAWLPGIRWTGKLPGNWHLWIGTLKLQGLESSLLYPVRLCLLKHFLGGWLWKERVWSLGPRRTGRLTWSRLQPVPLSTQTVVASEEGTTLSLAGHPGGASTHITQWKCQAAPQNDMWGIMYRK